VPAVTGETQQPAPARNCLTRSMPIAHAVRRPPAVRLTGEVAGGGGGDRDLAWGGDLAWLDLGPTWSHPGRGMVVTSPRVSLFSGRLAGALGMGTGL